MLPENDYGFAIRQGDDASALKMAQRALASEPDNARHHAAVGVALLQLGRLDEAEPALVRAVALDASIAVAHNGLGMVAMQGQWYDQAEVHFVNAIEADPEDTAALCNFATLLKDTGRGDEAAALMGPALEMLPDNVAVQWSGALMSNYAADLTPDEVAGRHRAFGRAVAKAAGASTWFAPPRPAGDGPLRIGFLSPDMRRHSVAFFLLPLIEAIDRKRLHVSCYSLCQTGDALTSRFEAAAHRWCDVSAVPDAQVIEQIRRDGIDILIDCAGLFSGARPAVLARRVAPLQATWLGYPNTTGLSQIDYRLVDGVTDQVGAERYAVEKLARLAGCFVCYQPLDELPAIEDTRDAGSPIRFGCFNVLAKFNDALLDTWARLLQAVPASTLMLKTRALASGEVRRWLCEAFGSRGIEADRLELVGHVDSQAEHRGMYNRVDVALDTFPYGGTTTTCEALVMGVPVVTLCGQSHPGRVGASLLRAAGCEQWVATTEAEYIQIAASLAEDSVGKRRLRSALSTQVLASPLCDAVGYARRFESAIRCLAGENNLIMPV